MKSKLILFLFCFCSLTVMGQGIVTRDKCKTCGKIISQCQYKGKHPTPSAKCSTCGKAISACQYRGNHPTTNPVVKKTFYANGVSFNMILVEGGTFQMGATSEQTDASSNEKPVHNVTLSNYLIGETEVTQELWKAVLETGTLGQKAELHKGDQLPVAMVSWDWCQEFITQLNKITNQQFRLPTEAEWEYAAKGGNRKSRNQYSGSKDLNVCGWYYDNSENKAHPVATKQPNELGIYDMSGNVWEWCYDWYDNYNSSNQTNPTGPTSGTDKVVRGGGYGSLQRDGRTSFRNHASKGLCDGSLGFRIVLSDTGTTVSSVNQTQKQTTGIINGHEWVDLGLPSGTKWATCNIGATKPEEYGKYYAWAEIETKSRYSWNNCKDCLDNTGDTWKKYKENGLQKISSGDDVAYQTWGQKWRLPTMDEASELYKNCKVTEETVNGINGIRITGPNSNSIFLPYSGFKGEDKILNVGKEGYYWTNELFSEYPYHAWCMEAFGKYLNLNYKERAKGLTIRPVTK